MSLYEKSGVFLLNRLDPEFAHKLAIKALRFGLAPRTRVPTPKRLSTTVAGLALPNPFGLAAGVDKSAEVASPLIKAGFGFVEVGAATPYPQKGNPPPRLFRLRDHDAVINRLGFNNAGMAVVAGRLARRTDDGIIGLNLGANADSDDVANDFATVLEICGANLDFATINVSSPNTSGLRQHQERDSLERVLDRVLHTRDTLPKNIPIFLKISPDLDDAALRDITEVVLEKEIDGIIATNTTVSREGLSERCKSYEGGLSGRPLFRRSTEVLGKLYIGLEGRVPLIGVGGIFSAEDAYKKIRAGANAVQVHTALYYRGLSLVRDLVVDLDKLLERDGFTTVADAVGADHR